MRIILLMIFFCIFLTPKAFSSSYLQSRYKDKTSAKIVNYDWSGFYTGLILGGQFGRSYNKTGDFGYNADNDEWHYNESGFNTGVEFGYNYPLQRFVVGPEIEWGYLDMHGSGAQPASPGGDTVGKTGSDFYTALRVRIGFDFNHYLIFATGGAIAVNYNTKVVDNCNIAPCGVFV